MSAARHNITIEGGADFPFRVTWEDSDDNPVNLTGYRVRWQIRQTADATAKLLDFDSNALASGMTLLEPLDESGVISMNLSAAVTSALVMSPGAVYDVTATSAGGAITRLLQGRANLSAGVTR